MDEDNNSNIVNDKIRSIEEDLFATGTLTRAITNIDSHKSQYDFEEEEEEEGEEKKVNGGETNAEQHTNLLDRLRPQEPTIWSAKYHAQRVKLYWTFLRNYIILSVILIFVLSFYWGAFYDRESRFVNLKMLIVNGDQEVNGINPILGNALNVTATGPVVAKYGGWEIVEYEDFAPIAAANNNSIVDEIKAQVHRQRYWGAIYVKPNVTYELHNAIENFELFNLTANLVEVYFETGRDLITMDEYVVPFLHLFQRAYLDVVNGLFPSFVDQLSSDQSQIRSLAYLSQPLTFNFIDMVPVEGATMLAPLELGLDYLVVFAFFQMVMTLEIQMYVAKLVKGPKFVLVRMLISQLSYLVLSLAYVVLNIAFQIPYDATFGKAGALVLWAISYLTMSSLGSVNECASILCFLYFQPMIGGWLVMLIVINVAPTTSSMALTNPFFRYGYSMPIHNSYELVKVVFCDIYKGNMGLQIGILVAWIVLSNLLLPVVMLHAVKVLKKRAAAAKAKGIPFKLSI